MFQQEIYDIQKAVAGEVSDGMEFLTVTGQRVPRLAAINQIRDYVASYVSGGGIPLSSPTATGTVKTDVASADPIVYLKSTVDTNFYNRTQANSTFLSQSQAISGYLSKTDAASTYLSQNSATTNYLALASAGEVSVMHRFIPGVKLGDVQFIASNTKPVASDANPVVWFKTDDRTTLYSSGASFVGREAAETHAIRAGGNTSGRVFDANYFGLTGGTTYIEKISIVYDAYSNYLAPTNTWECEIYLIADNGSELSLVRFFLPPTTGGLWTRDSRDIKFIVPSGYKAIGFKNIKTGTPGNITFGMTLTMRPYIA